MSANEIMTTTGDSFPTANQARELQIQLLIDRLSEEERQGLQSVADEIFAAIDNGEQEIFVKIKSKLISLILSLNGYSVYPRGNSFFDVSW